MKVFIVSSGRAVRLAQRLHYHLVQLLKNDREIAIDIWCSDTFQPGEYTLESLTNVCKLSDFAIIFLTKDDRLVKTNQNKQVEVPAPRDNCIFELGLFLGGLMFDRERCIILSTVDNVAFPSDIEGITRISCDEPIDLDNADDNEMDTAIKQKATVIANAIKTRGPLRRVELSPETLLQLERLDLYQGSLRPAATVAVKAAQPLELRRNSVFVSKIQENLSAYIKYRYFFHYYDAANLWEIATLVQNLATVGVPGNTPAQVTENMLSNEQMVRNNMARMKKSVSIDLMTKMVPLEFCVHNASNASSAICYLRLPNGNFIRYSKGKDAYAIASDLMQVNPTPPDRRPVFSKTLDAEVNMPGIREDLRTKLRDSFFPSLFHKVLDEVCFDA